MRLTRKDLFDTETFQMLLKRNSAWDRELIRELLERVEKEKEYHNIEK